MKKLLLVAVLFLGVSLTSFAQQKAKKEVTITAKKVAKTRGQNPNIKKDFVCDAPDVPVAKPEKSRGAGDNCDLKFDNWTGYDVKVYVDGYFKGWVLAWSNGSVTVGGGYTTVYCITAGGTLEWSDKGNCEASYTYKLSADNAN
ncbi:hypothetical protein SAMN05443549_102426 [Flavobacterium fluvii]|uniref:Uncharacterized protein n=1 Tax=Flavobacterium fluvii TaxID=468056 RepID=A0A1M5HXP3_9FLAO|nr:hypothetical protein [Flavobacterium fluvii]SHG20642.1 hypothetical protein SAMN05443549_102426 [Flavobacterium fluvii]